MIDYAIHALLLCARVRGNARKRSIKPLEEKINVLSRDRSSVSAKSNREAFRASFPPSRSRFRALVRSLASARPDASRFPRFAPDRYAIRSERSYQRFYYQRKARSVREIGRFGHFEFLPLLFSIHR